MRADTWMLGIQAIESRALQVAAPKKRNQIWGDGKDRSG
jgi:hypothetical protein